MSNVKIKVSFSSIYSRKVYSQLDDIDSDDEKEVDNPMNDPDIDLRLGKLLRVLEVTFQKQGHTKMMIAMLATLFRQENLLKLW